MQHPFTALRRALSHERLEGYRVSPKDDDMILLTRCTWNIVLSEALYPALHSLEIGLRNTLHNAISGYWGDPLWFVAPIPGLAPEEVDKVEVAKQELQKARKPLEAGRMVAELAFGFWTGLLNARYESILWPRLLRTAFPGMPNSIRTRKRLSTRLNDVRRLRNRVFHHEPIWYSRRLAQQHAELLETIHWINPEIHTTVLLIDRFPEVYQNGLTSTQERLATFLKGMGYQ
jgi:hypothetical protein